MFFGGKKLLLVLSICQFHSVVFNYSYKYHAARVMKLISLLTYEKRVTLQGLTHQMKLWVKYLDY